MSRPRSNLESRELHPLTPREREVLRDVIVTYILSGEPVSSRSVAKQGRHGLSAASLRNVMADLEEWGYLAQPHTSAGRLPTPAGYHLFIDSLMEMQALPARERRYIRDNLGAVPADAEELMTVASHLLSEMSQQASVVLTPSLSETVLKAVEFVPLTGSKVLCVVVSASGFVDSKVVETEHPVARADLVRSGNYLTESFAGLTLHEIRDRLLAQMSEARGEVNRLLALTIQLVRHGLPGNGGAELLVDGAEVLLNQPELSDILRVRRLFDTFADKARLVQLLNQCMQGRGVRVLIGADSEVTSALDFSLVTTSYGVGERLLGALGVFGPSRMEYHRMIPLVHYLGETLSQALAKSVDSGTEELNGVRR